MKLVRFLLFPFAILYDFITTIRNILFDYGFLKSTSFKIPVIVVGNLSVGGTGKTPQIEYLIRLLKNTHRVAVLSRGYKRKTKGFVLVNKNHNATDVGDEPLQYFKKFKRSIVAVDENRVAGIYKLIKKDTPEVVLLDDAYQHRKVKGSFYILLTRYNDLFIDDFVLPTGNLRESRAGANRADFIIVTKCPINLSKDAQTHLKEKLQKYHKKVFFTTISYADTITGGRRLTVSELKSFEVLLITGIENPNPLLKFLAEKEIKFKHLKFSDHHHFSNNEINDIQQKYASIKSNNKLILTTEKDYVRLSSRIDNLSYLEIKTSFLADENDFNESVTTHVNKIRL